MIEDTDDFTPDEKAYFESGGDNPAPKVETPAAEAPEPVEGAAEAEVQAYAVYPVDAEPKKDEKVPLATLLEERKQFKEERRRREEIERNLAVLNDRWETMLRASQGQQEGPKADEDPEPDPNVDIFAHQAWVSRQIKKENERRAQHEAQTAEQQRSAQLETQVSQYWHGSAAEFAKTTPDFTEAAGFLAKSRDKQLAAMASINPQLATEQGRNAVINAELKNIVIACAQQGKSPAEAVYAMAKEWGYAGKAPAPAENDPTKQVADLAAAVEGAKSLGSIGGGRVAGTSAQSIADMSDKEFEVWSAKPENMAKWRAAAGG